MDLTPGAHVGPYEVLDLLGEGGMGRVYRARDPRLGRDVALKVLPGSYSGEPERLVRFEQEARAAGVLNHPNILTVHDVGTHDGAPYIVAELLEGATLRERLVATGLPKARALDYALQIARGLAAAHEKGIVHRDLKPENLFVTVDGRVKILDFGLAKLTQPAVGPVESAVPTLEVRTTPGAILGTVGYMSPEQARGNKSDHRADIFAFGAILYEMLAGHRAFQGTSAVETLNAILTQEPPELPPPVSPALERISRHCLEKSPEARFQSARDLAFHLEGISGSSSPGFLSATSVPRRIWERPRLAWSVAALGALAAVVTAILASNVVRSPDATVVRFTIPRPEHTTFFGPPAASPDGRSIAFVAIEGAGKTTLWLRRIDSVVAQALPETDGAWFPFWSPDSLSIGFFAHGKLKRIEVSTGALRTICDAPQGRGGAWSRDGVVVFAPAREGPLHRVPAAGGTPKPVTPVPGPGASHRFPQFLPAGVHFLYNVISGDDEVQGVYVGSLDSTESKRLLAARSNALYAPPGYLLFVREGIPQAQRFDAERLELAGEPFPVADGVGTLGGPNAALFSISDGGLLVYGSTTLQSVELRWLDRSGGTLTVLGAHGLYNAPHLSPDGKNVAVERDDPKTGLSDIWVLDASSGTPSRVTSDPSNDFAPVWSPDASSPIERGHSTAFMRSP